MRLTRKQLQRIIREAEVRLRREDLSSASRKTKCASGDAGKKSRANRLRRFDERYSLQERRMATDVMRIVSRALNTQGPLTHQQLLANVLSDMPNVSDEEIDKHIDDLEASGDIIYDKNLQKYK